MPADLTRWGWDGGSCAQRVLRGEAAEDVPGADEQDGGHAAVSASSVPYPPEVLGAAPAGADRLQVNLDSQPRTIGHRQEPRLVENQRRPQDPAHVLAPCHPRSR